MKKLLIVIASAASIAGMAKAAALETSTGTSFTGNTLGVFNPGSVDTDFISGEEPVDSPYWSVPEGADTTSLQIKQGELPTVTRPTQWQGKDTAGTYLSIDISEKLTRKIDAVNENAYYDMGTVYFDSLVQFTATDTAPTPETGDKLIVWLKGTDAEEGVEATTNLVVTAGAINSVTLSVTATPYDITGVDIQPNTWHRLTIKTLADVGGFVEPIPGFKVYIDGAQVASGNTTVFPSLVEWNSSLNPSTLTSVSFQGTGAVDDIVFTCNDPFPEVAPDTYTITATADHGTVALYEDYECSTELAATPTVDKTVVYAMYSPAEGYNFASAKLNGVDVEPEEDGGIYYFTLTLTKEEAVTADAEFVFAVTTTAGGDEPGDDDWKDPADTKGQTAAEAYGIGGELATADATKLTAWATANNVQFSDKDSINPKCFLLDIANDSTAGAITAAEEEAKEEIGITQISVDEKGNVKLTYPDTYGNGVVVVEGKAELTDETWHDKTEGDQFFRTVLKISK